MKKVISLILALTLILALGISAGAANEGKFLHKYYAVSDGYLYALGSEVPSGGSYEITFASQTSDLKGTMNKLSQTGIPTTVYCLVETWKDLPEQAFQREIEVLTALSKQMSENDKMIIATYDDEIKESNILDSASARTKAIEAISQKGEARPFYEAVVYALNSMSTKKGITENKCLVILSDGHDTTSKNTTEDMVMDLIKETTIPVYGVAALKDTPEQVTLDYVESVARLAQTSVGGTNFQTSKGNNPSDIGIDIWKSIQNSTVIQLEIASIETKKLSDVSLLTVVYDTGDKKYEDSVSVKTIDLTGNLESIPPVPDPSFGEKYLIPIVIGAAAVTLIAAIVIIAVLKKRKNAEAEATSSEAAGEKKPKVQDMDVTGPVPVGGSNDSSSVTKPPEDKGEVILPPPPPSIPGPVSVDTDILVPLLKVVLTQLGQRGKTFEFKLHEDESKTLGRIGKFCDVVLYENDTKLSKCHSEFCWSKGKLYVKDKNSTNGTYINGVVLVPGTVQQIKDFDTIKIGAYEYRISTAKEGPDSNKGKIQDYEQTLPL